MKASEVIALTTHLQEIAPRMYGAKAWEGDLQTILAALARAGLRVVPEDPTKEMLVAGADAWANWLDDDDSAPIDLAKSVFCAMIAAFKEG